MTQSLADELRVQKSDRMRSILEDVSLRLFAERGFSEVTVEEIASAARVSPRTFYRYFAAKEDVLQLRIEQRSDALREALVQRPASEPPLRSIGRCLEEIVSTEDPDLLRRWMAVVASTPTVLRAVLGGIQLKSNVVMAEFIGERMGTPSDSLIPTMLAAAAGGVILAAHTQWLFFGGSLGQRIAEGIEVLEGTVETGRTGSTSDGDTTTGKGHAGLSAQDTS
jgi:TetR/AcrR family transcriptional regulator, regulator of mycofactocin system